MDDKNKDGLFYPISNDLNIEIFESEILAEKFIEDSIPFSKKTAIKNCNQKNLTATHIADLITKSTT